MKLAQRVEICEVGMRDGLQIEPGFVSTEEKIEIVNRLSGTGLRRIQVSSFVSPKAVPQLADAAEVFAGIRRAPGVVYSALVPNERGAQRAIEAGVDELDTVLSASDTHNLANVNMTTAESLDRMSAVAEIARRAGVPVVAGISTAFGCPFEGAVPLERLEWLVRGLVALGVKGVCLADTTGMANPLQVQQTFEQLVPRFRGVEWHLHMHDTRAMGIPGILAAMAAGVSHFDASFGGLGGCPFAPGASGNVCTEDLIHCLEAMGVHTGVDLEKLVETATRGEQAVGHPLRGQLIKAGPSSRRYEPPEHVRARLAAR